MNLRLEPACSPFDYFGCGDRQCSFNCRCHALRKCLDVGCLNSKYVYSLWHFHAHLPAELQSRWQTHLVAGGKMKRGREMPQGMKLDRSGGILPINDCIYDKHAPPAIDQIEQSKSRQRRENYLCLGQRVLRA